MNDCIVFFYDEDPYLEQVPENITSFTYLFADSEGKEEKSRIGVYESGEHSYLYVGYPSAPNKAEIEKAIETIKPKAYK